MFKTALKFVTNQENVNLFKISHLKRIFKLKKKTVAKPREFKLKFINFECVVRQLFDPSKSLFSLKVLIVPCGEFPPRE